ITVNLAGQPQIQVTPTDLSFFAQVNKTNQQTFTVTNTGAAGSTLNGSVKVSGAPFSGNTNFSLGAGKSQTVTITYSPTDPKQTKSPGTATVSSNAANEDPVI